MRGVDEVNEPQKGERCRVFYGSEFYRSGEIIDVNRQEKTALVRFDYDIPDEWEPWRKLC